MAAYTFPWLRVAARIIGLRVADVSSNDQSRNIGERSLSGARGSRCSHFRCTANHTQTSLRTVRHPIRPAPTSVNKGLVTTVTWRRLFCWITLDKTELDPAYDYEDRLEISSFTCVTQRGV